MSDEPTNVIDDREFPVDIAGTTDGLKAMLAVGPGGPEDNVKPEIPEMPKFGTPLVEDEGVVSEKTSSEGEEKREEAYSLPDEATKQKLKAQYGDALRVVPMPYDRMENNKIKTYILRQLTRIQWQRLEQEVEKIAAVKPKENHEEIFMEKVVCAACVWPQLEEPFIKTYPAGLIQTLFGIVRQQGLFFDPEILMSATFAL